MKEFNDFEKDKIRLLINADKPCLGDFIADTVLVNSAVAIDRPMRTLVLWHLKTDANKLDELFDTISLIEYLRREMLIFVHTNPVAFQGVFLSNNWNNDSNIPVDNILKHEIPTNVYDLILEYINSFYHPTSDLKNLVEDNFETLERKQLNEALTQTKYSKGAFVVAILALIFTVGYSYFKDDSLKFDKDQIIEIKDFIEKENEIRENNLTEYFKMENEWKKSFYVQLEKISTNKKSR
ncbi:MULTISPECIES: hypothetical protein [Sphingobacterium]|uniref:hypothetical protein n=1 Tax=Sphingobacterium TaxID=28453 RepID=UPI00257A70EC|nr:MULTISPECIES: hypothetical protein [Sphingobacterium]